jgi:hypothetical protein
MQSSSSENKAVGERPQSWAWPWKTRPGSCWGLRHPFCSKQPCFWLRQQITSDLLITGLCVCPHLESIQRQNLKAVYYFFSVLGFELRASHSVDTCFTTWAIPPAIFAPVILEIGSCFSPRPAWTVILLFYASLHCFDDRCVTAHPSLFHWDGSPKLFLP